MVQVPASTAVDICPTLHTTSSSKQFMQHKQSAANAKSLEKKEGEKKSFFF